MKQKRALGERAEKKVCQFLKNYGLRLLSKNFRSPYGEIDLIMQEKDVIIFIEVRCRKNDEFGTPLETISLVKQSRITKTAWTYLQKFPQRQRMSCRFDVVGLNTDHILWYKNAFAVEYDEGT